MVWITIKKIKPEYIYGILYGMVSSLGCLAFLSGVIIATFHEQRFYPRLYAFYEIVTGVSFIIGLLIMIHNLFYLSKQMPKGKAILIESVSAAIAFVVFSFMWAGLIEWLQMLF